MTVLRVLALLAVVVAVVSSASIGPQTTCCGPAEWEALALASAAYGYEKASSNSMSGRLAVSHDHNIAALLLMSEMMGNMTMVLNESKIYVYFVLQHHNQQPEPQPQCAAYVLENVIADITSSCFPTDKSSPIDRISTLLGSLPINLVAYEFGGLAGLLSVQMFASGQDCSPMMFALSTPDVSNGPQLSVLLSNVQSGVSDRSILAQPPTACLGVTPLTINMGNMGRGGRRGSGSATGGMGPSSGSRGGRQWIEDMVAMYVLGQMQSGTGGRSRRDLKDLLGLDSKHDSSSSLSQVVESAASLRLMLQALSDFIGQIDGTNNRGPGLINDGSHGRDNNRGPSFDPRGQRSSFDQNDVDALVSFLVQRNLISGLGDQGNNRRPFDQNDMQALASLLIQRNLMQSLGGDRHDQSNADQLAQLEATMQKIQMAKNVMQLIERAALYETQNSNQGPDLSHLLRLAAVDASAGQNNGPDYRSLVEMLTRQQQQHH